MLNSHKNCYQFQCGFDALHQAFVKAYQFLWVQKIASQYFCTIRIMLPPLYHRDRDKWCCSTGFIMIALITTWHATILLLGLGRFLVFQEKWHHFYSANFIWREPSWPEGGKIGQLGNVSCIFSDYHSIIAQHHHLTDAFIAFNWLWWRRCITKFLIQQSARSDRIDMF